MLIADKNITFKSMKVNKLFYFIVLIFFYKVFGIILGFNTILFQIKQKNDQLAEIVYYLKVL
ncbi:hypothetical protein HMPREF9384_2071 [Streptococcus sanguinis SK160]|uniref:Uncharacterized protein n=2 Tax=Streptococcus sanguinis TaxID=1305 RepID=F0IW59_STRSA|nr:hypothetical protein HMPREF9382_0195 [Streptococcus sanguinis SK115]EGD38074.1 hypothetical protein HMPREF9384_2071 [Streptococcus sanguinis SK160]